MDRTSLLLFAAVAVLAYFAIRKFTQSQPTQDPAQQPSGTNAPAGQKDDKGLFADLVTGIGAAITLGAKYAQTAPKTT